jgi:glycosyltransferase involved in cell wall biosynthesis
MHIVIDLNATQGESRFRGIGRYSLSLARALAIEAKHRKHRVSLVMSDMFPESVPTLRAAFEGIVDQSNISIFATAGRTAEMVATNIWRTRASEMLREEHIASLKPDVLHVASLFEGWLDDVVTSVHAVPTLKNPTAVTLYDLIPYVMSEIYLQDAAYKKYYFNKLESLKRSDLLLAISESSRKEAIKHLMIKPEQVVNISAAVDSSFQPQNLTAQSVATLHGKYGISRPFVFYVPGGFDPRKNFDRLLEAYTALPTRVRKAHQLVIGSKAPADVIDRLLEKSKALGLKQDELVLTDYVGDTDLLGLYSTCSLYVFPSLHEGFGLPALEAMACGAPVIASNSTSLPEVIGRAEALFDPQSITHMTELLLKALTDQEFRKSLIMHGPRQAAKFSWERSARLALDAFEGNFMARSKVESAITPFRSVKQRSNQLFKQLDKLALDVVPSTSDVAFVKHALLVNQPKSQQKQLFIDISELVNRDAKSGIQRVVRSILLHLLGHPPQGYRVEPVYSETGYSGLRYARQFTQQFLGTQEVVGGNAPISFSKGDVYIGLDLTAHLFPGMNVTLRQMRSSGVKIHYVVYDLTPLNNRKWHSAEMSQAFTGWIDSLTQYSDSLVCISKSVSEEVKTWLRQHPPQPARRLPVSYFHLGADIQSSLPSNGLPDTAEKMLRVLRTYPSFLMVGTVEPRKGHAQSLDAFEQLWEKGSAVNLVIVGKAGWNVDTLISRLRNHPELSKRLHWLEGISDEYLQKVYRTSTALLAASYAEGFGLPLIEAAQYELPIIARGLPVFKEVAGKHAFYFNGVGARTLAISIKAWLALKEENRAPSSTGMKWLTWVESSEQLLKKTLPWRRQQ